MTPGEPSTPGEGEVVLLARETEQLERIAERLRSGRPIVAFIACDVELRSLVIAWLSKASRREVPAAEEEEAERLLARMAAPTAPEQVKSLAWRTDDRDAIGTLNLHREKLRRGGSTLVWCSLSDLTTVQTEAQDAFSFRDTLVVVEGLRLPSVHVPQGDTPEIALARARYELPGTPFEKALAAAELSRLLLARHRVGDAFQIASTAIEPILQHRDEGAARGTFAFVEAVMAAVFAMAHQPLAAWQLARATVDDLLLQGVEGDEIELLAALQYPGSPGAVEAAHALMDMAGDGASVRLDLHLARMNAALALDTGDVRSCEAIVKQHCALAGVSKASDEAGVLLRLATGDLREAQERAMTLARRTAAEDGDNRPFLLHLGNALLQQGEIHALDRLIGSLHSAARGSDLGLESALLKASFLSVTAPKRARQMFRSLIDEATSDGALYRVLHDYVLALMRIFAAGRASKDEISAADSLVQASQSRLPEDPETSPPFYRILIPGLRADLLVSVQERRAESVDLARGALDLARAEHPQLAPAGARTLVRSLLFAGRLEEGKQALAEAEPEAEALGELRVLARLRALRVAIQVRSRDSASEIDMTMAALHDTLQATGSARVTAETLLGLARILPVESAFPDPLELAAAQAERFAEMPMPALEELCRETRGDVLLARGFKSEAAACFAAAETRLRHYGLLLYVPRLARKRARAAA